MRTSNKSAELQRADGVTLCIHTTWHLRKDWMQTILKGVVSMGTVALKQADFIGNASCGGAIDDCRQTIHWQIPFLMLFVRMLQA